MAKFKIWRIHRFGKAPNKEDARCNPEGEHQSKECKVPPTTKKLSGSGNGDGGGHDDKTNNSKIKHKKQNKNNNNEKRITDIGTHLL